MRLPLCALVLAGSSPIHMLAHTAQQKPTLVIEGRGALMQGRVADALIKLQAATSLDPQNGQAHLLLCRTYYSEGSIDAAVRECEAALQTSSKSSEAQDWMGKVYGAKAEHAGPLTGYNLAKKVKASFEMAVMLDPENADAVDDLGDYYVQAPSIVGGGVDKAVALADRTRNKEHTFRVLASIAEKQKDYVTAERYLMDHVRATNGRPDTWLDIAGFYQRRGRNDQAIDAVHHAHAATHDKSSALVGIAEMSQKLKQDPTQTITDLQDYLSGGNTDDTAPTFRVHVMLGNLEASRGDKAAAKIEFEKALALAPDYAPAKKGLASL